MPVKPKCVDASCTDTEKVFILMAGKTKQNLWVAQSSLPWLLSYAADQLSCQGVVCEDDADACTRDTNCPAVADLNVEWDFNDKTWQSEFLSGPCQGIKRSFSASLHTEARWEKMRCSWQSTADVPLSQATPQVRKQSAKEFLISWCDAIARGEHAGFEREWGVGALKPAASTTDSPQSQEAC